MAKVMHATRSRRGGARGAGMMKAVRIHAFGGPEALVYENAPRPRPLAGDVLVRVHAAGVNPLDMKVRDGWLESRAKHALPLVLGWDVSGVVEETGPGVTELRPGDEVFGRVDFARDGAYAQYIAVRATELARRPEALDPIRAAAMPIAALTAWQALFDTADLRPSQRVLIHRAAGGVGHLAVQLARWKGAYVIGTAGERNREFVSGLGADEVIDYGKTRFEDAADDVDVVLDSLGGDAQKRSFRVLRKGGILVSIVGPPDPEAAKSLGVRATGILVHPDPEQLNRIARLVLDGTIDVHVEHVLALAEARRAHELIGTGHVRGKIVLRVE